MKNCLFVNVKWQIEKVSWLKQSVYSINVFGSLVGFNSRWGYIVSIFDFDWGSDNILIGWGCNQDWGFNRADTV